MKELRIYSNHHPQMQGEDGEYAILVLSLLKSIESNFEKNQLWIVIKTNAISQERDSWLSLQYEEIINTKEIEGKFQKFKIYLIMNEKEHILTINYDND